MAVTSLELSRPEDLLDFLPMHLATAIGRAVWGWVSDHAIHTSARVQISNLPPVGQPMPKFSAHLYLEKHHISQTPRLELFQTANKIPRHVLKSRGPSRQVIAHLCPGAPHCDGCTCIEEALSQWQVKPSLTKC